MDDKSKCSGEPVGSAIQSSLDQKIFDAAAKENDLVRLYIRETEADQYSTDAHRALNDLYKASATLRELLIEYLNSNEAPQPAEPVNKMKWNQELSSWSDEDFVQVFHERPDLANRLRKILAEPVKHDLYKTGDKDAPEQILDRNGAVALDCCKRCGKFESQLSEPCVAEPVKVPSDTDIIALAISNGIRKSSEHWGDRYYTELGSALVGFARALLAKYGQPVQPADIWPLVEKYAETVCEYKEALRLDAGLDGKGQACIVAERELRAALEGYAQP